MPIRLDLLAEQRDLREVARRDPVRRTIRGAIVFVSLISSWYIYQQFIIFSNARRIASNKAQTEAQETEYNAITEQKELLENIQRRLNRLEDFTTNRFLWTHVFDALQELPYGEIQISLLASQQSYELDPGKKGNPEGDTLYERRGVPEAKTESISVTLEANDFSIQVGREVDPFLRTLQNSPFFKENLRERDPVTLTKRTRRPHPIDENDEIVEFTLTLSFPPKELRAPYRTDGPTD